MMLQDFRFSLRALAANPLFTFAVVLTLTLGIGVNAAVMSVVESVLLRPFPYPAQDRLVVINTYMPSAGMGPMMSSADHFFVWKDEADAFEILSGYRERMVYVEQDSPQRVRVAEILPDLTDLLGIRLQRGRFLSADDFQEGRTERVLLSDSLWHRQFGADPAAVGRTIDINGRPHEIVGILAADFKMPRRPAEALLPWALSRVQDPGTVKFLSAIGRLKPSVQPSVANEQIRLIHSRLVDEHRASEQFVSRVATLMGFTVGDVRTPLLVVQSAVALVFLIALVNVANLLLARTTSRRREVTIRAALGAGRLRLASLFLSEGLLLATAGGLLGATAAVGALKALHALDPGLPRFEADLIPPTVFLFVWLLSVLTALICAAIPFFTIVGRRSSGLLLSSVRGTGSSGGRAWPRFLTLLETAMAVLLLTTAGLLMRSFLQLQAVRPGFGATQTIAMQVDFPRYLISEETRTGATVRQLLDRVRALPGVEAASATQQLPLSGSWMRKMLRADQTPPHLEDVNITVCSVAGDYFKTLEIPMKSGRDIPDPATETDWVVVDELFARTYWPDQAAVGRRFSLDDGEVTVAGVVGNVRHHGLKQSIEPTVYVPLAGESIVSFDLIVRSAIGDISNLAPLLRQALREALPGVSTLEVRSMNDLLRADVAKPRFDTVLVAAFAIGAALLAAIGIYGVLSHSVSRRTSEIGVRVALGASPFRILAQVVSQGMKPALGGMLIGLLASVGLSPLIEGMLYQTDPHDPIILSLILAAAALIALAASSVPALRALRVNPVEALRAE